MTASQIRSACDDGYDGPANLVLAGRSVPVRVRLAGFFEPVEGRFRWYGRARATAGGDGVVAALAVGGRTPALLRTPHGEAEVVLGDPDFWGRPRIWGVGSAPFEVNLTGP